MFCTCQKITPKCHREYIHEELHSIAQAKPKFEGKLSTRYLTYGLQFKVKTSTIFCTLCRKVQLTARTTTCIQQQRYCIQSWKSFSKKAVLTCPSPYLSGSFEITSKFEWANLDKSSCKILKKFNPIREPWITSGTWLLLVRGLEFGVLQLIHLIPVLNSEKVRLHETWADHLLDHVS